MFKNILQLYSLFVCFVCIIVFLIVGGGTINSIVGIYLPEYMHTHAFYDSDDAYVSHYEKHGPKEEQEKIKKRSKSEIKTLMDEEHRHAYTRLYRQDVGDALHRLSYLFIAALAFFVHWRIYRRSEKE